MPGGGGEDVHDEEVERRGHVALGRRVRYMRYLQEYIFTIIKSYLLTATLQGSYGKFTLPRDPEIYLAFQYILSVVR